MGEFMGDRTDGRSVGYLIEEVAVEDNGLIWPTVPRDLIAFCPDATVLGETHQPLHFVSSSHLQNGNRLEGFHILREDGENQLQKNLKPGTNRTQPCMRENPAKIRVPCDSSRNQRYSSIKCSPFNMSFPTTLHDLFRVFVT